MYHTRQTLINHQHRPTIRTTITLDDNLLPTVTGLAVIANRRDTTCGWGAHPTMQPRQAPDTEYYRWESLVYIPLVYIYPLYLLASWDVTCFPHLIIIYLPFIFVLLILLAITNLRSKQDFGRCGGRICIYDVIVTPKVICFAKHLKTDNYGVLAMNYGNNVYWK